MIPSSHENEQRHYWPMYTRADHIRLVATTFPNQEHCLHCGAVDGFTGAKNRRGHWWTVSAIAHDYGMIFRANKHYKTEFADALPSQAHVTDGVCGACRAEGRT